MALDAASYQAVSGALYQQKFQVTAGQRAALPTRRILTSSPSTA
jgi:hypothetical protein